GCGRTPHAPPPDTRGTRRRRRPSRPGAPIRWMACARGSRDDRRRDLLLVSAILADARPGDLAPPRDPLGDERRAAGRARLGHRPRPQRELAGGIVGAGVEGLAAPGAALHHLAPAALLRTRDAERERPGGLALWIPRAGDELAEAAVLDHHRLRTGRARL